MDLKTKVAPGKAALLVVDMQNDFCHSEGASGLRGSGVERTQKIVPTLNNLIAESRKAGVPVFFIRAIHNQWTDSPSRLEQREDKPFPWNCREGTWGAEFYGVAPEPGDPIVTKHRYSAVINTDLDLILRAQQRKTIILTGVATNGCVESTARDGFMMDYHMVFVGDCSATSAGIEPHNNTLKNMARGYGVVVNGEDLAKTWGVRSAAPELSAVAG